MKSLDVIDVQGGEGKVGITPLNEFGQHPPIFFHFTPPFNIYPYPGGVIGKQKKTTKMPKLTKKKLSVPDGRTDHNYRKAPLKKNCNL